LFYDQSKIKFFNSNNTTLIRESEFRNQTKKMKRMNSTHIPQRRYSKGHSFHFLSTFEFFGNLLKDFLMSDITETDWKEVPKKKRAKKRQYNHLSLQEQKRFKSWQCSSSIKQILPLNNWNKIVEKIFKYEYVYILFRFRFLT
jgi:hypothetical protein